MTLVALAEAALIAILIIAFTGLIRSQQRSHARREDQLLNQLLHAVGKPWQEAPADTARSDELREKIEQSRADREEFERTIWVNPEQRPVT